MNNDFVVLQFSALRPDEFSNLGRTTEINSQPQRIRDFIYEYYRGAVIQDRRVLRYWHGVPYDIEYTLLMPVASTVQEPVKDSPKKNAKEPGHLLSDVAIVARRANRSFFGWLSNLVLNALIVIFIVLLLMSGAAHFGY